MIKYSRLTKEQFEEMQEEFINFLAAQSITGKEWDEIKRVKPEVAEEELDIFSDLIWEGVLNNASYLENISAQQLFLFKVEESFMKLIVIKTTNKKIDFTTVEGYQWLQKNFAFEEVAFFTANKDFTGKKNGDIFSLIQQGAIITKGSLFSFFNDIVN
ncbi:MAG: cag pathogenicity island protein 24 [Flavobacteriaceae bacterium]|jgi:cag pathogenicity island protein 24